MPRLRRKRLASRSLGRRLRVTCGFVVLGAVLDECVGQEAALEELRELLVGTDACEGLSSFQLVRPAVPPRPFRVVLHHAQSAPEARQVASGLYI